MKKYAKIIDYETQEVQIGAGCSDEYYAEIGMALMNVEQAYNGAWYLKGYAPDEPEPTPEEKAQKEIADLRGYLQQTDYVAIKIAEGAATQQEYADVIAERAKARVRIKQLGG